MTVGCAARTVAAGLELARLAYEASTVRVMVLRDQGRIVAGGSSYELRKGTEIEMPRWLARILAAEGVVELVETPLTLEDIARTHFGTMTAKTVGELEQLPREFYQQVAEYVRVLDERVRREFNAVLLEEKQKATMYASEIAGKRLSMILQALRTMTALGELHAKLTVEEEVLLDTLTEAINEWRRRVFELLEGRG